MRIATAQASRGAALVLALSLITSLLPVVAFATPGTPEIEAKQAEASVAQAELERMNAELEVQVEEYNAITESLELTREEIRVTQEQLECARQDLEAARGTLSDRATSIYKRGGTSMLEVFLGAKSFEDFMALLDLAVRINRSDAEMVAGVKEAKARVEATALALEQRQAEQLALQSEASARASEHRGQSGSPGALRGRTQRRGPGADRGRGGTAAAAGRRARTAGGTCGGESGGIHAPETAPQAIRLRSARDIRRSSMWRSRISACRTSGAVLHRAASTVRASRSTATGRSAYRFRARASRSTSPASTSPAIGSICSSPAILSSSGPTAMPTGSITWACTSATGTTCMRPTRGRSFAWTL